MHYAITCAPFHITSIFINYAFAKLSSALQIFEQHCAKCIIVVLLMLLIAAVLFVLLYTCMARGVLHYTYTATVIGYFTNKSDHFLAQYENMFIV